MHFFCIFFSKNLHISKIFCTFAPDLKTLLTNKIHNYGNNQKRKVCNQNDKKR